MKKLPEVSQFVFYKNAASLLKNPLPFHTKNFTKNGDIFKLNIGLGKSVVFSKSADLALEALQKNSKAYKKTEIQTKDVKKYLGVNLLTAEGDDWKKQRKLMQPSFYKKNLENLITFMHSSIKKEVDRFVPNETQDIFPIITDLAFKTVARSLFGKGITDAQIHRLQYITEATQKMLTRELRQPYLKWWFVLSGKIQAKIELLDEGRQIILDIIEARKSEVDQKEDLLDLLMHSSYEDGSKMSQERLLNEVLVLFMAGHETTANVLTFIIQLLAKHPNKQDKLAKEILENQQNENKFERLKESPYTNIVINEGLRLYPPAYYIDRVNLEDIEINGYRIQKNATLLMSIYHMQRDPNLWNDPESFEPERFIDHKTYTKHFFPFGAGPRKCIGNMFALYEMNIALQEIISRYHLESSQSEIEINPLITLKPKNAFVKFIPRN